jgi:hypothetical protein
MQLLPPENRAFRELSLALHPEEEVCELSMLFTQFGLYSEIL